MRIGEVIGTVTLSRWHSAMRGGRFCVTVPLSLANLAGQTDAMAEELIAYDDLGAGEGSLVAVSEGGEAAQPFRPHDKPIDAYIAAILDQVRVEDPHAI